MDKKEFITKIATTYDGFKDEDAKYKLDAYLDVLEDCNLKDYKRAWILVLQTYSQGFKFPPAPSLVYSLCQEARKYESDDEFFKPLEDKLND